VASTDGIPELAATLAIVANATMAADHNSGTGKNTCTDESAGSDGE
jgi:hypothetical protein